MKGTRRMGRRRALALFTAVLACLVPACESGGHFSVLGYTTHPNYDCGIKTVRVPIFENRTFRQGLEFELTQAVIREIESKTPFKVVSHGNADTELKGKITIVQKNTLNSTQLNEIREGETILTVEVVWKDLRSGRILSRPMRRPGDPIPLDSLADAVVTSGPGSVLPQTGLAAPAFPTSPMTPVDVPPGTVVGPAIIAPVPIEDTKKVPPTILTSRGTFIPELGQSITSSMQVNVNRMATQIVNMMESPW